MATPLPPDTMEQDILDYIANYQAQQANINALNQAALAAAQGTGASNIDYYVNPIGAGEIIPGLNAGILSNLGMYNPEYQAVMQTYGSRNDQTNVNDVTERSTFAVDPNADYRLLDASGKVIGTASTPSEVRNLVDTANSISAEQGKKAEWSLQTTGQTGDWSTVAKDDPNKFGPVGIITDFALPLLSSAAIPGVGIWGTILPAAAGSAASSVLQGRGLEDTLLRAGLAGAGAGIGEAIFTPGVDALGNSISNTASNAINAAYQAAQQGAGSALGGVYGSTVGSSIGSAAGSAAGSAGAGLIDDIIVTAIKNAPSVAGSTVGSVASSLAPELFKNINLNATQTPTTQTETQPSTDGGEIFVDAIKNQTVNLDPGSLIGSTISSVIPPSTTTPPTDAGELVVTGKVNPPPSLTESLLSGAASTVLPEVGPLDTPTTKKDGVLGTGLSLTELATLGGLGASAVGSLFGGSGGTTGAGTPYVSPFGTGGTMAGGQDFRASPAIADYERYGFGPEASFFRPEYYGLVSGGASKGYTPPAGTTTPSYTPLIGGGAATPTVTPSVTPAVTPTPTPTPAVQQVRPEGFTGVVSGQQVGDTQVVDGNTWVWGGDDLGWQRRFDNGLLSTGNGATNVTSFANNPTVEVNQPYFAQNTANIPGWATTYHGFQQGLMGAGITGDQKAAAERELFTAIETQPFANAQSLVDYARGIYNKYTNQQSTSLI